MGGYHMQYGAGDRIRTGDLLITNQLLYRLSYASMGEDKYWGILDKKWEESKWMLMWRSFLYTMEQK